MNILLIYATNSGTTQVVAQRIADKLTSGGHKVTVQEAFRTKPDDLNTFRYILYGSPSWDFDGKVGMPHMDFLPLMEKLRTMKFTGKQFAIFGLGDTTYKIFCGAVDHLEKLVKETGGTLTIPSLRIDDYYSDSDGYNVKISAWTEKLMKKITEPASD